MKKQLFNTAKSGLFCLALTFSANAQTNVFDDVIASSPNHTILEQAIVTAGLSDELQSPAGTFTVFAPDDAAFTALFAATGLSASDLLTSPELSNILLYHVLGSEVLAAAVTNGAIVTPLFSGNTLKLTKTAVGSTVYVNQAQVTTPNLTTDNGIVHSVNGVLLSMETVVDIAIDNGFTSLTAAVAKAELLPALSNPFTEYTVFAPNDLAFTNIATALGTDLNGLLALTNLSDILLYHVTSGNVVAADLTAGPLEMLNTQNTIINLTGGAKINDANIILTNVEADNGVVHAIDKVILATFLSLESSEQELVSVYPNPVTNELNISNDSFDSYIVYNTVGQVVQEGEFIGNSINTDEILSGTYTLILKSEKGIAKAKFTKI
jgi:uncharacterized surface protein with fasciclin (FAS1) repeats